jgi:hypothetical protein
MKRNILFGFLLIGLVVMEWGCDDIPAACKSNSYNVVATDSTQFLMMDSNSYLKSLSIDSVAFDEFVIKVDFKTELISYLSNSSSLYATPPCPPPNSNWFIDKISVLDLDGTYTTDWEIAQPYYKYFIDIDSIRGNEFWNVPINMYLKPKSAPSKTGSYKFSIRIETTEGNVFEIITDPIIITP